MWNLWLDFRGLQEGKAPESKVQSPKSKPIYSLRFAQRSWKVRSVFVALPKVGSFLANLGLSDEILSGFWAELRIFGVLAQGVTRQ
jgi:hypothetical protein